MTNVNDVHNFLDSIAPEKMAKESDNVGFLVGTGKTQVSKILVCLDITSDVISEALDLGAEVIVAHHPLFFSLSRITDKDITGKKIISMLSGGISAICMHTNLDAVRGGVNDALAIAVGITDDEREAKPLSDDIKLPTGEVVSLGRIGYLKKACSMPEYLEMLKKALNVNGLRYHDAGKDVYKIAIASGSGGGEWDNAVKSQCDTFVTADIKYHMFLDAKELGLNIIDAGHYSTENLVSAILAEKLSGKFPDVDVIISKTQNQIIEFI